MSRTRKTRPIPVRMADPKDNGVDYVEIHNHVNDRECDLPESVVDKAMVNMVGGQFIIFKSTKPCHYSFHYNGHNICGCRMCTQHYEHRAERRKERHEAKSELNRIRKHVADEYEV
jgi:hypothetical protein